jgi:hypothetical protein
MSFKDQWEALSRGPAYMGRVHTVADMLAEMEAAGVDPLPKMRRDGKSLVIATNVLLAIVLGHEDVKQCGSCRHCRHITGDLECDEKTGPNVWIGVHDACHFDPPRWTLAPRELP